MDDQFMYSAWRRPRQELAQRIRARLEQQDLQWQGARASRPALRAAAYAATVVLAVGAFALPSVRAGAAAFLDLFRVVNFAPISVQPERLRELAARRDLDLPHLLGDQVEMLKQPGEPIDVADAQAAGAAAGIQVRMPLWLPQGMQAAHFKVLGENQMRVTLSTQKLQIVLDALGIKDLRIPSGADGQSATIDVPRIATVDFRDAQRNVMLWQARQPLATLPTGVDIPTLAEVGLRILGVDSTQASTFAHSVDWRTTLLVPIPANVADFRQVSVQGNAGLLVESRREAGAGDGVRPVAQIMWSAGNAVYVMIGNVRAEELVAMAQSLQ